jgi:Ca2+-binding RTX toxin-like protein
MQFVGGKAVAPLMAPAPLAAEATKEIVLDASGSTASEVFALALAGLGTDTTLVLKGVEGAVLVGAGTVRVDGTAGARIATDSAAQTLTGGGGNDVLVGSGDDVLAGGAGQDLFAFGGLGHYVIGDFAKGEDKLGFKGLQSVAQLATFVTAVQDDAQGITFEFGAAASIRLVGVHAADISGDMIQFGF